MKDSHICSIIKNDEILPGIFSMELLAPDACREAEPGQFVHIKCPSYEQIFLRRPISICDVEGDVMRLVYEVRGKGTKSLSLCRAGDKLDVLAPLGHGFILENTKKPLVIGGGIGTFPLYYLCRKLPAKSQVYLGFRSKDRVLMEEDFQKLATSVVVTTDDGSYGIHGFATTYLEEALKKGEGDCIYACGPMPMLKIVKSLSETYHVKAQLSLEQRMGCGIGACLTCSCETNLPGTWRYKRVCLNGPVFWADEVTLND